MAEVESQEPVKFLEEQLGKSKAAPIVRELKTRQLKANTFNLLSNSLSSLDPGSGDSAPNLKRARLVSQVARLCDNELKTARVVLSTEEDALDLRTLVLKMDKTQFQQPQNEGLVQFRRNVFRIDPTPVLHRMLLDREVEVSNPDTREGLIKFFSNQPDFNMRSYSSLAALRHTDAFKDIPLKDRNEVAKSVKMLQCTQALTSKPECVPILINAGVTSAFHVSSFSREGFLQSFGTRLGHDEAIGIHQHAMASRARSEQVLTGLLQTVRGSGIVAVDGPGSMDDRKNLVSAAFHSAVLGSEPAPNSPPVIDLESMFGSLDYCECSDCNSVLSAAAYFVELLQFLRNNNLSPSSTSLAGSTKPGIAGTALENLFARRPDLGCLELTCENTNTILPYIDLSNEVMESFIVHRIAYKMDTHTPRRVSLDIHNVEDETSNELLSQPQYTNYDAYCPLKDAVFPIVNAPYHQPMDETRIFLEYLTTSRYELLTTFIPQHFKSRAKLSGKESDSLQKEWKIAVERSAIAEFWKMTSVEYIAITREHFWTKRYYEIEQRRALSQKEYSSLIQHRGSWEYWGFTKRSEMDGVPDPTTALRLVKKQLLWRSGLLYAELVEMVKTKYINQRYPSGRDLQIFQSIQFSYEYLQSLLDRKALSPCKKFRQILKQLLRWKPWMIKQGEQKGAAKCGTLAISRKELLCWLETWFDAIGDIIVLDSGERPRLPIQGYVLTMTSQDSTHHEERPSSGEPRLSAMSLVSAPSVATVPAVKIDKLGWLSRDGNIKDSKNQTVGYVAPDSLVVDPAGKPLVPAGFKGFMLIFDISIDLMGPLDQIPLEQLTRNQVLAIVSSTTSQLFWPTELFNDQPLTQLVEYMPATETCNIDNVNLVHLNGTDLNPEEWDRFQIFIRLYRKLGWTINEIDTTIIGLAEANQIVSPNAGNEGDNIPEWQQTLDKECSTCKGALGNCRCGDECPASDMESECDCDGDDHEDCEFDCPPPPPAVILEVSPKFLHDLAGVKKIVDLSGLPLQQVLTLWTDIPIQGNPSLYDLLFLNHPIYAMDPIFKQPLEQDPKFVLGKISEHTPVILAALKISSDGLTAVMGDVTMTDELTLANISTIYRYVIMSRILRCKLSLVPKVIALFGKAFGPRVSATTTLGFIKAWQKMQSRGFTIAQFNYLLKGDDDPLKPIGPSAATIFTTAKTVFDGLTKIDTENPDYTLSELALLNAETIKSKLSLLYDAMLTERIVGLLEGTTLYTSQAPTMLKVDLTEVNKKAMYSPEKGLLTVTGILTQDELKKLILVAASNKDWIAAVEKVRLQPISFFDQYLSMVFSGSNASDARTVLLDGDVAASPPSSTPDSADPAVDPGTAEKKRSTLMQGFMSYLRRTLAERFVIDAASVPAGLNDPELAKLLFTTIIMVEGKGSALEALLDLANPPEANSAGWSGSLIPPTSGDYTFYAEGEKVTDLPEVVLDGNKVLFTKASDEVNATTWVSGKVTLMNGRPCKLLLSSGTPNALRWMIEGSPPSDILSTAILPDYSQTSLQVIFMTASKIGIMAKNFPLSLDEIAFLYANSGDFASIDFNNIRLDAWNRVADYTILRDSLPAMPKTLLDVFKWAKNPDSTSLTDMIHLVTNWATGDIAMAIRPENFNCTQPLLYQNEIQLLELQRAMDLRTRVGIDIGTMFAWSRPTSFVWEEALFIAASVRKQVRSRFDVETWEKIAKPLFDKLRMNQRDALIAFLLVQEPLRAWGVTDADSLFEFFLIDVQMGACLQTSRIKQAISSVQIFIQRCLLDLERDKGSETVKAAQARYNGFMSGYRVWQANREVFLWPENWLDPALRDDKSSNFKALEAKLLQQDVKPQTVQDEIRGYIFRADQVAHLVTVGIVEDEDSGDLHFFAKSSSTPWSFFYRKHHSNGDWSPWEAMGVDILTYDLNAASGALSHSGSYVLPVLWNNRLLVFLPEFSQKQVASDDDKSLIDMGGGKTKSRVVTWWEIKLAWTEYRNGAWTPKQISARSVAKIPKISPPDPNENPWELPPINNYQFIPRIVGSEPDTTVLIGVFKGLGSPLGWFSFDGGQVSVTTTLTKQVLKGIIPNDFMFVENDDDTQPKGKTIYSYQYSSITLETGVGGTQIINSIQLTLDKPYVFYPDENPNKPILKLKKLEKDLMFYDPISHPLLARATTAPSVDGIFDYFENKIDETGKAEAFGNVDSDVGPNSDFDELKTPYSLGNWEIGCYVPMLLMNKLLATQQFDEALNVAHYVFNPFATRSNPPAPGDIWRWPPFKNVLAQNALEVFFAKLKPNTVEDSSSVIQKWRDNPFQPFVVARGRRQAIMRWFAIQYIRILIAYGDYYFVQYTLETIPLAIQLYVRASHIYGQRPQQIPKRGNKKAATYNSLLDQWDAFSNAIVQLELAFPFSNQIDQPTGQLYNEKPLANLFGFATSQYFCIPNNPNLIAVRDLINDRLSKIRHCLDINGVFRVPPLFEPPIDPGLLVQAAAAGISIASALSDLNSPMPNYKFYLLLQKALELCGELKSLGGQYLSTKEKIDGETLSNIRARQETVVSGLVMQVKKQALDEANAALGGIRANRVATEYKMRHFLNLLGQDLAKIPDENTDYAELDEMIEAPSKTNNTYKLIGFEFTELSKSLDANNLNSTIGTIEALAGALRKWSHRI